MVVIFLKKRCLYCGQFFSGCKDQKFCSKKCAARYRWESKKGHLSDTVVKTVRIPKYYVDELDRLSVDLSVGIPWFIRYLKREDHIFNFFHELRPFWFTVFLSWIFFLVGLFYGSSGGRSELLLMFYVGLFTIASGAVYIIGIWFVDRLKLKFVG